MVASCRRPTSSLDGAAPTLAPRSVSGRSRRTTNPKSLSQRSAAEAFGTSSKVKTRAARHGQTNREAPQGVHLQEEPGGEPPAAGARCWLRTENEPDESRGCSQGAERAVYEKKRTIRKALEGAPLLAQRARAPARFARRSRSAPAPPQRASPFRRSCTRKRRI